MNFYVVFCRNRKKFDKYVKVNRIRNKVIIDIKENLQLEEIDYDKYRDYFNLLIYTKILQAFRKNKDIYYIPNFDNETLDVDDIFKIKKILTNGVDFNLLLFWKEFETCDDIRTSVLNNIDVFDNTQMLRDY